MSRRVELACGAVCGWLMSALCAAAYRKGCNGSEAPYLVAHSVVFGALGVASAIHACLPNANAPIRRSYRDLVDLAHDMVYMLDLPSLIWGVLVLSTSWCQGLSRATVLIVTLFSGLGVLHVLVFDAVTSALLDV